MSGEEKRSPLTVRKVLADWRHMLKESWCLFSNAPRSYVNIRPVHPILHFAVEEGVLHTDTEHIQSLRFHFDRCFF